MNYGAELAIARRYIKSTRHSRECYMFPRVERVRSKALLQGQTACWNLLAGYVFRNSVAREMIATRQREKN